MKVYAKLNTSEQIIMNNDSLMQLSDNTISVNSERPEGEWHAKADGKWHPGDPDKEILFIDIEMQVIAEQLLMHEDKDDSAVATENDWREYRKQLRKWNWDQNQHFPNPDFRPKRPE